MKVFFILLWILTGSVSAYLYLKMQSWSVRIISPHFPKQSQWLIVGGAFFRWLLIIIIFILALSYSTVALLIVFLMFMTTRLLLLLKWQGLLSAKQEVH